MTVVVDGDRLTLDQVERVARAGESVALDDGVGSRMADSHARVERVLARGGPIYGTTTGLGERKRSRVDAASGRFHERLIESHRVGAGSAAAQDVVRATMVRLLNGFAKGTTGVRPVLAERLVDALNHGRNPHVRLRGSVGMADLAPMADLAAEVFGDMTLRAKEGLALVNNNAFSTGLAALALVDARRLLESLAVVGALDLEAFAANLDILDPVVARTRPYHGAAVEADRLRTALRGSPLWSRGAARNLQDPLCYRSIAQLHGTVRDALEFTEAQVGTELNAHDSNPLAVPGEDRVISVGSFDALPVATALDFLRAVLAPCLTSCLERTAKLLQAPMSGLASGLSPSPELGDSGLAELLWTMHALTGEARLLAQPVASELATTTVEEGIADRVTHAPLAARRLAEQTDLAWHILAIELVVAAQGVDLRHPPSLGAGAAAAHARVRALVPFTGPGTPFPVDLDPVAELARSGALLAEPGAAGSG